MSEAPAYARRGDVLVGWKPDRLRRPFDPLIEVEQKLRKNGLEFRSLQEMETSTSGGGLIFYA